MLHYDGSSWRDVSPTFTPEVFLQTLWMPAGDPMGQIWAIGGQGTILRGRR
jgi:hypothetical protein